MPLEPDFSGLARRAGRVFGRAHRRLLSGALELFFPHCCRLCGAALETAPAICERCAGGIEWIGSACGRCGMAVLHPGDEPGCAECRGRKLAFDAVFAAGLYTDPLRRLILIYKARGDRDLLEYLAGVLEDLWRGRLGDAPQGLPEGGEAAGPVVVPVPGHPLKNFLRGSNPAAGLARQFARRTGLPLRCLLSRTRWTRPQTGLPRQLRLRNPRGIFRVRRRAVVPPDILLVDDVVTTCATVSDAARALRAAGARRVHVLALARSPAPA